MSEPKQKPDDRILTAELWLQVLTHHPFMGEGKSSPARLDFCRLLWGAKDCLEGYVEDFFKEGYRG
jgi:hypothetical protein